MLSVSEPAALLGDVESVALINGVPTSFGAEAERRGFIAYQLARAFNRRFSSRGRVRAGSRPGANAGDGWGG
jgi:hypothetical protein